MCNVCKLDGLLDEVLTDKYAAGYKDGFKDGYYNALSVIENIIGKSKDKIDDSE